MLNRIQQGTRSAGTFVRFRKRAAPSQISEHIENLSRFLPLMEYAMTHHAVDVLPDTEVWQLGRFVSQTNHTTMSEEARTELKKRLLDTIGVAIGALDGEPIRMIRTHQEDFGGNGLCTLIGGGKTALGLRLPVSRERANDMARALPASETLRTGLRQRLPWRGSLGDWCEPQYRYGGFLPTDPESD